MIDGLIIYMNINKCINCDWLEIDWLGGEIYSRVFNRENFSSLNLYTFSLF